MVWVFFNVVIFYILYAAIFNKIDNRVWWACGFVLLEGIILVFNGWKCPLTNVAERYTDERHDNFDIYLPLWLAKHNKAIYTTIFAMAFIGILLRMLLA